MTRSKFLAAALTVTSALAIAGPTAAQAPASPYPVQMAPAPTPDADALANAMRRLAASPRDLDALLTAGELSLKVGDASGAAALFKRAEGVDPMNGRVKAGMARILVTQERPGEALRYFDQAVGYGLDPRSFAGDRGLAYDLIGENERAQRDYRLALKSGGVDASGDEVRRRYALSLGIAGKQLAALEQIDPLTRRNDRGAWRARAFILAMTGDVTGANVIASRMMPGAMAQGLAPFFTRLPTLSPTDKAFAVHFGEIRPTPQRLADARLIPTLPVLGPDPDLRVQVAAQVAALPSRDRRDRRRRKEARAVQVARTEAAAVTPGFGSTDAAPVRPAAAAPVARTPAAAAPRASSDPARLARQDSDPFQRQTLADLARAERYRRALAEQAAARAAPPRAPSAAIATPGSIVPRAQLAGAPAVPTSTPVGVTPAVPSIVIVSAPPPVPVQVAATTAVAPAPTSPAPVAAASSPVTATAIAAIPSSTLTPPRASEDTILSRIVSGLTIPGSELGVGSPPPAPTGVVATAPVASAPVPTAPAPAFAAATPPRATASAVRSEGATADAAKPPAVVATRSARRRSAVDAVAESAPPAPTTRRGARAKAVPVEVAETSRGDSAPAAGSRNRNGGRAADRTVAEDDTKRPTTRAGRLAAAAAAAKVDADQPEDARGTRRRGTRAALAAKDDDASAKGKGKARKDDDAKSTKGETSRIWVQVAGGANEKDLPKAWSAVQSRTPALRGKQAYSTPLRATNRVVTGPFKTDAEARAFINQLARQGVSAFPFTSDKGQKVARLPPK